MRTAYFECFSGVSSNMLLGALLDAGLSINELSLELGKIAPRGYAIEVQKADRGDISATLLRVLVLSEVEAMSGGGTPDLVGRARELGDGHELAGLMEAAADGNLSDNVKQRTTAILRLMAQATARVHGLDAEKSLVFKPVSVETLIEIVGVLVGLELLGVEHVECSPINLGGGLANTPNGTQPVPAPVTAEILRSALAPIYGTDTNAELVSTEGAALIASIATAFGPIPAMRVNKLGYGAGKEDIPGNPNVLRVYIGDTSAEQPGTSGSQQEGASSRSEARELGPNEEWARLIETNLSEMTAQHYEYLIERMFEHGASEAFLVPTQMRKNHAGVMLSVVCTSGQVDRLSELIFDGTDATTLRISDLVQRSLQMETSYMQSPYGPIKVQKAADAEGKVVRIKPDQDDLRRIADEKNVPVERVYEETRRSLNPQPIDGHQQIGRHRE